MELNLFPSPPQTLVSRIQPKRTKKQLFCFLHVPTGANLLEILAFLWVFFETFRTFLISVIAYRTLRYKRLQSRK